MNGLLWFAASVLVFWVLAYRRAAGSAWLIGFGAYLGALTFWSGVDANTKVLLWTIFLVVAGVLVVPSLRKALLFRGQARRGKREELVPARRAGEELTVPPHRAGLDRLALGA